MDGIEVSEFKSPAVLQEYVNHTCKILEQEDDSDEAIKIETGVIHYLCGPYTKRLYLNWLVKIFHRREIEKQLYVLLGYIEQLLQYPYNHFRYITFYIALNRRKHIINAILDKGAVNGPDGLSYSSMGDLKREAMETFRKSGIFVWRRLIYLMQEK